MSFDFQSNRPSHSNFINELAKQRGTFIIFTRLPLLDQTMACKRTPFGRLRTRRKRNCSWNGSCRTLNASSSHEWVFHDEWLDGKEEAIRRYVKHGRDNIERREKKRERNDREMGEKCEKIAGYIWRDATRERRGLSMEENASDGCGHIPPHFLSRLRHLPVLPHFPSSICDTYSLPRIWKLNLSRPFYYRSLSRIIYIISTLTLTASTSFDSMSK